MIGYVHGKVLSKSLENTSCVILCGNVGYEVTLPRSVADTLVLEQTVSLWVHTHVREDVLSLYGFLSDNERSFFRLLLSLSGLGPKGALSLLSEHGASGLVDLVLREDIDGICQAPGIGKKLAQRVVLDLKAKVQKLAWVETHAVSVVPANKQSTALSSRREDLTSALQNLGFAPQDVRPVLDKLEKDTGLDSMAFEVSLRLALKELSRYPMNPEAGALHA